MLLVELHVRSDGFTPTAKHLELNPLPTAQRRDVAVFVTSDTFDHSGFSVSRR
jgi:hypothetical protein